MPNTHPALPENNFLARFKVVESACFTALNDDAIVHPVALEQTFSDFRGAERDLGIFVEILPSARQMAITATTCSTHQINKGDAAVAFQALSNCTEANVCQLVITRTPSQLDRFQALESAEVCAKRLNAVIRY